MPEPALALSTEDRILLYLSDFHNMEERYVLPHALSQKAIAYAAGIQRKHLSRYLDEMVKEGTLTETKAHIEGEKQRMLAYYLATRGWDRARAIKERLATIHVPVRAGSETKMMTLDEIDKATSVHLTFSDIVREAMEVDTLDLEHLAGIEERRKRDMDERVKDLEDYARALMTAWKDGRVTATERLLIEQLREHLGISKEEHERIENRIVEEVLSRRREIYHAVAVEALDNGPINAEEREILEVLGKKLGLSPKECADLESSIPGGKTITA
jgi:tellurite resistance protein